MAGTTFDRTRDIYLDNPMRSEPPEAPLGRRTQYIKETADHEYARGPEE